MRRSAAVIPQLGLSYGAPSPEVVGFAEVPGDAWIGVSALVHWSRSSDGWVELSLSGQASPIVASGANMHNNYAHFLKIGTYRDPEIQATSCVHVRRVSIRMCPR